MTELTVDALLSVPGAFVSTIETTAFAGIRLPELVVYADRDFGGAEWRTNIGHSNIGDRWNDKISSFIIVSGIWEFYKHVGFDTPVGRGSHRFGPGYYRWVGDVGIENDSISSLRFVAI